MAENVGAIHYTVEADTSKLVNSTRGLDTSLDRLNQRFGRTDRAAGKTSHQMTKTAAAVRGLGRESSATSSILARLGPVIAGLVSVRTAQNIIAMADAWTGLQNRLRLVTQTSQELAQATDAVFRIAQSSSQEIDTVATVYQRFAQNADALGLSLSQVADVTDVVSKAVAVSGASAESARAALVQCGQGLASGVLRGEEFNSVMEQTPGLAQAIADGLGVPIGSLREMAQEGELTSDRLIKALNAAAEGVEKRFATRVKTAEQAMVELRNATTRYIGEADQATGLSRDLADGIDRITQAIQSADVQQFARDVNALKAAVDAVTEGFETLFDLIGMDSEKAAGLFTTSFADSFLATAKELDFIAGDFQGFFGGVYKAVAVFGGNIETVFARAWAAVRKDAEDVLNGLIDGYNKFISYVGGPQIDRISFGGDRTLAEVRSITQAYADGYRESAKGLGLYDKMLERIAQRTKIIASHSWEPGYDDGLGGGRGGSGAGGCAAGPARRPAAG